MLAPMAFAVNPLLPKAGVLSLTDGYKLASLLLLPCIFYILGLFMSSAVAAGV
jgi:hypothetical protein